MVERTKKVKTPAMIPQVKLQNQEKKRIKPERHYKVRTQFNLLQDIYQQVCTILSVLMHTTFMIEFPILLQYMVLN